MTVVQDVMGMPPISRETVCMRLMDACTVAIMKATCGYFFTIITCPGTRLTLSTIC